ncbi:MAG: hypothetical protein ACFE0I_10620 [Elainellaceae cyanobacterium]
MFVSASVSKSSPMTENHSNSANNIFLLREAVKQNLKQIPGVVSVGIGLKQTGKTLTNELSFRVYVNQKKPLTEVPPDQVIPTEIAGFKTDVITAYRLDRSSTGGTRPLVGGITITSLVPQSLTSNTATLGCVALMNGTDQKMMLSNEHVFDHTVGILAKKIYQPKYSKCLGFICNEVGQTVAGKIENVSFDNGTIIDEFHIDCAIASINSDIRAQNAVAEIGMLQGSQDLITSSPPIAVKKKGQSSGLTQGTVEEVAYDDPGNGPVPDALRVMIVHPNPGHRWERTYQVRPEDKSSILELFSEEANVTITDLGGNRLRFVVNVFSLEGDSGSVILNSTNQVVGLHFAGSIRIIDVLNDGQLETISVPTGRGFACHIAPILEQFDIRIQAGTLPTAGSLPLPEESRVPVPTLVPGGVVRTELEEDELDLNRSLQQIEQELRATRNGSALIRRLETHLPEIMNLVHHHRRVKVTWHRLKGPAFVVHLVRALHDRQKPFCKEIEGISLQMLANRMYEALMQAGSEVLRNHLVQLQAQLVYLLQFQTMDDVLNHVKRNSAWL